MTDSPPDYMELRPPDGKPVDDYTRDERRAELLHRILDAGGPNQINQTAFAEEVGVSRTTIWRDMDELRDSIDEHLGRNVKLTARAAFVKAVTELQNEGEWKKSWDVVMDWADFLADRGALERAPDRREVDVNASGPASEDGYEVIRPESDDLPRTEDGEIDYEAMGFRAWPGSGESLDAETARENARANDDDERAGDDDGRW